jgi:ribosomal protein S18 acetylase RimI-like enzyme
MIQIRKARSGDAEYVVKLNEDFNGVTRPSQEIARTLQTSGSSETVLIAEEFDIVIGFACIQILNSVCYNAPWMEVTELYVVPTHRQRGAGKALVCEAIRRAEQAGVSEVLVRTNVKNEAARNLYTQIGLEVAPDVVFRLLMR